MSDAARGKDRCDYGSGIGFASAEHALAEGARVIGVDLNAEDMPDWGQLFALNVKACWQCLVGTLPSMRPAGGGSAVLVASQLAFGRG